MEPLYKFDHSRLKFSLFLTCYFSFSQREKEEDKSHRCAHNYPQGEYAFAHTEWQSIWQTNCITCKKTYNGFVRNQSLNKLVLSKSIST